MKNKKLLTGVIAYFALIFICMIVIYVIPSVRGMLVDTYLAEQGEIKLTNEVEAYVLRDEKVYVTKKATTIKRVAETGKLYKSGNKIVDMSGEGIPSSNNKYSQIVSRIGKKIKKTDTGNTKFAGYIVYKVDGAEGELRPKRINKLKHDDFEQYCSLELKNTAKGKCAAGDPIFKVVKNGKYYMILYLTPEDGKRYSEGDTDIRLDAPLAKRYYEVLHELSETLDFGQFEDQISLGLIAKMPDVIKGVAAEEDEEAMLNALLDATNKAIASITEMREVEGSKLVADIAMRADLISDIRNKIEKRAPELEKEYAAKFKARIEELLDGAAEVPEERIALEAAIFADKANITEELVRLDSHINQLREFLKGSDESIGKKIDFLIQEMNREANTIGSKSNDKEITSMMLDLKAEIEKIREQVQNIE